MGKYFTFEKAEKKNKDSFRIVNLETRAVNGQIIMAGTRGGYIENPDLIDQDSNLWIYESANLRGNVAVSGNVSIKSATITDCEIRGNVMIGSDVSKMKQYPTDSLYRLRHSVIIIGSEIDSTKTDIEDAQVTINDRAYIKDSKVYGDSTVNECAHVLESCIMDTALFDHVFITKSVLNGCSFDGGSMVVNSTLTTVDGSENVSFEDAVVDNRLFDGTKFIHDSIVDSYYPYAEAL